MINFIIVNSSGLDMKSSLEQLTLTAIEKRRMLGKLVKAAFPNGSPELYIAFFTNEDGDAYEWEYLPVSKSFQMMSRRTKSLGMYFVIHF